MARTFAALQGEYGRLWSKMVVKADKSAAVNLIAQKLLRSRDKYLAVAKATGVPWHIVAVIDQMEGGGNASTHLHNGDSLAGYTHQVPAGRPHVGHGPPFTFVESAIDAIRYDGLDQVTVWSPERTCFELEKYNGWGYRGKGINTPYLWSYSNHYTKGKYVADGVYDSGAVSQQCGTMPIIKRLGELDKTIGLKQPSVPSVPLPPAVKHISLWSAIAAAVSGSLLYVGSHPVWLAAGLAAVALTGWIYWRFKSKE